MNSIFKLKNVIQNYSWGSIDSIPNILGIANPDKMPMAELWMGVHPRAPSILLMEKNLISLSSWIARDPVSSLGQAVSAAFSGRLPFLFKLLAAQMPLSIQVHPDLEQARAGFERENREGISLDHKNRVFLDDNHKPEVICALTDFYALNGFMPYKQIIDFLQKINCPDLARFLNAFSANLTEEGFHQFLKSLVTFEERAVLKWIKDILEMASHDQERDEKSGWLSRINNFFPLDRGILIASLMNLVVLKPGEAMYIPARQPHAYLSGTGVELMANSDNVIRLGLTPKHVDTAQFLKIITFKETSINKIKPTDKSSVQRVYPSPAKEFLLQKITTQTGQDFITTDNKTIHILLCVNGSARIICKGDCANIEIKKGDSFLIPASVKDFTISGKCEIFAAGAGIE